MNRFLRIPVIVAAGMLLTACASAAPMDEEEELPAAAVEKDVPFPPFPSAELLVRFDAGAASANAFFLDRTSLSIGDDEVVRFVLVIRAPSGVENVSFEGIRCQSMERRLYATGRSDRTWSKSRNSSWMAIGGSTLSLPHHALARQYLCDHGLPIRSPRQGLEAIRRGGQANWFGT